MEKTMDYSWYDLVGNIGVFVILAAYLALQLNKITHLDLIYSLANGLGAILIIISLIYEFNLSAFTIEFFWLLISLIGVVNYFRSKNKVDMPETEAQIS